MCTRGPVMFERGLRMCEASDGGVVCLGDNASGQATPPAKVSLRLSSSS